MKFSHYLKRLHESEEWKKFKEKHKNAYLCAGFFVLDFEAGKNTHQIDYCLPSGKIATFHLDEGVKLKISEQLKTEQKKELKKLEEIKGEAKTDLDVLKGIVEDEMKNRTITQNLNKIIAVLISKDKKLLWILNCITKDMTILKVHIADSDSSILEFEKISMMDIIRKI